MSSRIKGAGFLVAALLLAGCNGSIEDIAPKANQELPQKLVDLMKSRGMSPSSPIMVRIFKEEGQFEVWKQEGDGGYGLIATYPICKWSGQLGPKFTEGDRQAPEGFYEIRPSQMNPKSKYYLSFNIGFPNAYDRAHNRTGANLMVHGACSSSGCYSMNDAQVAQIYAFAREAFRGGQEAFQIEAFPFRMTAENMARYRDDPNYEFWKMLKQGYDQFEIAHLPPKVDVCEGRYVFNEIAADGHSFPASPNGACPPMSRSPAMAAATAAYDKKYDAAFAEAVRSKGAPPSATIDGIKEATLVADWSRRRGRGERVPMQPPALDADGKLTETAEMGRIDSPIGRKMAALEAEKAAKEKAEQEKAAALAAAKAEKERQVAEAKAAKEAKIAEAKAKKEAQVAEAKAAKEAKVAEAKAKKGTAKQQAAAQASANPQEDAADAPQASAMAAEPQRPRMLKRIWNKMFGS
jgi:murein L,D-transpeptidase YafK